MSLLSQPTWRIMDQSSFLHTSALESFAHDDTLCTSVGSRVSPATARTWVHENTIVLGIQDTRLPFLSEGVQFLEDQGYRVIVRNSGGLAVVLDEGVLNISLIFSEVGNSIDIERGYDAMVQLVQEMFKPETNEIEAYEIVGSYCPGSYDLSIGGKKFAGISQRRIRGGVAVQIYLCVHGSGSERAEMIRQFYEKAKQGTETKFAYPTIQPETMASLEELLGTALTVEEVLLKLYQSLQAYGAKLTSGTLSPEELALYPAYLERVVARNEKALHDEKSS